MINITLRKNKTKKTEELLGTNFVGGVKVTELPAGTFHRLSNGTTDSEDLIARLGRVITPEEKKENWRKHNIELVSIGILPLPECYESTFPSFMEDVEKHPEVFIVPECIPACKEFWSKNIYTRMVCDYVDQKDGWSWIAINSGISNENMIILDSLANIEGITICKDDHWIPDCYYINVRLVGKEAQERLLEIAQMFKMQDVPENYAYKKNEDGYSPKDGEIIDGDRVYHSEYHYKKHLNYIHR